MPHLSVLDGAEIDKGKNLRIPADGGVTIGRDTTADLALYDARASRLHLRVEVREDGIWAVDLHSKNGTFVNSNPVTEHRLQPGDHVRVGDTVLLFVTEATAQTSVSPKAAASVAKRLQAFYRARTEKNIPILKDAGPNCLIAFDIEGTLITTDGLCLEVLEQTLREACSLVNPFEGIPVAGRSEAEIIRNVMKTVGMPPERIRLERPRLVTRYVTLLGSSLRKRPRGNILPGVRELLEKLKGDSRWALGLLTRKTLMTSRVLLGHHGLLGTFPFGAFADDRDNREALPALLLERARETTGITFAPKEVYAVGDAARDVAAARAAGLKTVAVATGADSYEALADVKPDLILHSLEDVDDVLRQLNAGMPSPK
jgi:phosphoglycolate phosphatase-like HAD superfamily hydrolase